MPTIPGTLRATARRVPETVAVIFEGASCTYAELDADVDRTAHALAALGLGRGDRFALMATSSDRFIVAFYDHHRTMWVGVGCALTTGQKVGDRFLHVAPLYHAAELCIMLVPGTMVGATHVVMPGFDPVPVLDVLESEQITMLFGVPTMFQLMLRAGLADRDLPSLRTALFGAAPMPASAVVALTEALPQVDLMQLCGQTEGGPGGIYATLEQVKERPDTSGKQATMFAEVRVVDTDGNDVQAGEVGEMILRGTGVMKGYWNKPEETAATIKDGWLHTGDLARLDADGYLTLVDRLKDLIITGGRNVYSVEVESAVAAHPDVTDVAVVAKAHETYGESIVAVVSLAEGASLTLEEVQAFCADKIARYKIPHELVVAAIPRNPSGKILKRRIREEIVG